MSEYSLMWLSKERMYRELRKVAKNWPREDTNGIEKLGFVLYETWSAVQRFQPFPEVGLLSHEDRIVGVLCGFVCLQKRHFDIQHLVVASWSDNCEGEIHSKLVEAAIDLSQNHGFHGWVSCTPEEEDIPAYRNMGFSLHHDGLTYCRMGYFTRL